MGIYSRKGYFMAFLTCPILDKKRQSEYHKAYAEKNPEKAKARQIVRAAIKDGTLQRKPCQRCGDWPVHAHHPDYSQPLKVWWLCPKCHARITKLTKEYIYVEKSSGI